VGQVPYSTVRYSRDFFHPSSSIQGSYRFCGNVEIKKMFVHLKIFLLNAIHITQNVNMGGGAITFFFLNFEGGFIFTWQHFLHFGIIDIL